MAIPRSPEDLRELAAMNARTYAMSEGDREQWYRDHPVSDYEAAARDSGWEPARYSLNGYAREHLILSWREVPGRGLVVIGADMAETELRTARDAEMYLAGLASAECAVHDGTANSSDEREGRP